LTCLRPSRRGGGGKGGKKEGGGEEGKGVKKGEKGGGEEEQIPNLEGDIALLMGKKRKEKKRGGKHWEGGRKKRKKKEKIRPVPLQVGGGKGEKRGLKEGGKGRTYTRHSLFYTGEGGNVRERGGRLLL